MPLLKMYVLRSVLGSVLEVTNKKVLRNLRKLSKVRSYVIRKT